VGSNFLQGSVAIRVFLCFAFGYALSFALRTVNAVIAPDLVAEFGLSNAQLGALSSAYFFSFALMQLPLGIWLDRFGSRKTHAGLLCVAALGCACFGLSQETWMLWVGRALIGMGVSGALMASFRAFRFWYPAEQQSQLASWMLVAGSMGALASTLPVQWALPVMGWRGLFNLIAVLLIIASTLIFFLLPTEPASQSSTTENPWAGYITVFKDRYFWRFAAPGIGMQASFVAFQSLWAGPWLIQVLGMSADESAQTLLVLNFFLMMVYWLLGWASPQLAAKGWTPLRMASVGGLVMLIAQTGMVFMHGPWAWTLWLLLGLGSTTFMLTQTHVNQNFPPHLAGRAFTAYNLLLFAGMFLVQWLFGVLIDALSMLASVSHVSEAFRGAMLAWVVFEAATLAVMVFWRVPRTYDPALATPGAANAK
jgi:MFS family permease